MINWNITIVLPFVFVVVLILGVLLRWYGQRQGQLQSKETDWADFLPVLKHSYPEAFEVLTWFEENKSLEVLGEGSPDLDQAIGTIRRYVKNPPDVLTKANGLTISPAIVSKKDANKLKAALVTVVRGIYSNPQNLRALDKSGQKALDSFIDSMIE